MHCTRCQKCSLSYSDLIVNRSKCAIIMRKKRKLGLRENVTKVITLFYKVTFPILNNVTDHSTVISFSTLNQPPRWEQWPQCIFKGSRRKWCVNWRKKETIQSFRKQFSWLHFCGKHLVLKVTTTPKENLTFKVKSNIYSLYANILLTPLSFASTGSS